MGQKRVTILVDGDGGVDSEGDRRFRVPIAGSDDSEFYVRADRVVSVEDVPDPLPTEPGVRFYGRSGVGGCNGSGWWFVAELAGGLRYVSGDGFMWTRAEAEKFCLVRLPDPEPQP